MKLLLNFILALIIVMASNYAFAADAVDAPNPATLLATIFACLFAISEALASISSINSNSIFQLIRTILKKLAGK